MDVQVAAPALRAAASVTERPVRRQLHIEIDELTGALMTLGALADDAIGLAVQAVVDRDVAAAERVVAGDAALNRLHLRIREHAFSILLTQAPVACDLRNVLAQLQMSAELERIGDHCVSIAKESLALAALPDDLGTVRRTAIGALGRRCAEQLRDILGAVLRRDDETARRIALADTDVDILYHRAVDDLIARMREQPQTSAPAAQLLFMAHHLERIGDRVTNLAEDLVYLDTGEIRELD